MFKKMFLCLYCRLALYVYEYLLHVGAQKSAQTFLSEIRWEKNITLGEPPGFLHSWWCVFWDLYCAAPERRETCEHSSEAKAFHDYSAAAAPSPVLGNIPPGEGMPVGPVPPGFFQGPPGSQPSPHAQPPPHNPSNPMMGPHSQPFMSPRYPGGPRPPLRIPNQPLGGVPGTQPLLPSGIDPTRQQGHPNMGGPMQRMTPPRGMVPPLGPQVISNCFYIANYSKILKYCILVTTDSTNSSDNMYTIMNAVPPGANRSNFPMGPGSDGPIGAMGGMEPHHMNGSLGNITYDNNSYLMLQNSPSNISMSNPPGTPRDDGEMGGNFLNPFQSDSVSIVVHFSFNSLFIVYHQLFITPNKIRS
uniref:Single stranded DNA binding protein 2 n=1 Tax=Callorhinchus milii TaxID=7868 RepID=A0A4W3I722_CALMI